VNSSDSRDAIRAAARAGDVPIRSPVSTAVAVTAMPTATGVTAKVDARTTSAANGSLT
jgi:hypothetical protein